MLKEKGVATIEEGVATIGKDIKRLKISEEEFLNSLKGGEIESYTSLSEIPVHLIPDLVEATKVLFFHIITLNTIVDKIGVENIGVDFEFKTTNSTNFVRKIASYINIGSDDIIAYVHNKKAYIDNLLSIKKNKQIG